MSVKKSLIAATGAATEVVVAVVVVKLAQQQYLHSEQMKLRQMERPLVRPQIPKKPVQ